MALTMLDLPAGEAIKAFREHLDRVLTYQPSDFHLDSGGSFLNAIGDHGIGEAITILSLALASGIAEQAQEGMILQIESNVDEALDAYFQMSLEWVIEMIRGNYEQTFKPYLRDIAVANAGDNEESDQP